MELKNWGHPNWIFIYIYRYGLLVVWKFISQLAFRSRPDPARPFWSHSSNCVPLSLGPGGQVSMKIHLFFEGQHVRFKNWINEHTYIYEVDLLVKRDMVPFNKQVYIHFFEGPGPSQQVSIHSQDPDSCRGSLAVIRAGGTWWPHLGGTSQPGQPLSTAE